MDPELCEQKNKRARNTQQRACFETESEFEPQPCEQTQAWWLMLVILELGRQSGGFCQSVAYTGLATAVGSLEPTNQKIVSTGLP